MVPVALPTHHCLLIQDSMDAKWVNRNAMGYVYGRKPIETIVVNVATDAARVRCASRAYAMKYALMKP